MKKPPASCQNCGRTSARRYEEYVLTDVGESVEPKRLWLCAKCARQERQNRQQGALAQIAPTGVETQSRLARADLIAALDRFWAESGAGEICRRCHEQGTGCCPPMCRYLGETGCLKKNVFCTSFVCSALLNAISECDPVLGRLVKWIKLYPGAAEFRLYEMVTRVPAVDREPVRPLVLPTHYPGPLELHGEMIKTELLALADEVLEIRRQWHQEELGQVQAARKEPAGNSE